MADQPDEKPEIPGEKPKIIVDEDWKTRVQAEKDAAKQEAEQPAEDTAAAAGEKAPPVSESEPEPESAASGEPQAPPASFVLLVTSLATQAMATMGLTADPASGKSVVRLDWAKHFVDMLGVLDEKTKNNLTEQEQALLDNALHELRMTFVAVQQQQQAAKQQSEKS